jgi:hypothetical protein
MPTILLAMFLLVARGTAASRIEMSRLVYDFIYNNEGSCRLGAGKRKCSQMAANTKIALKVLRGQKMKTGRGWRLISPGATRGFKATLIKRIPVGGEIIAIFRVLPMPEKRS